MSNASNFSSIYNYVTKSKTYISNLLVLTKWCIIKFESLLNISNNPLSSGFDGVSVTPYSYISPSVYK